MTIVESIAAAVLLIGIPLALLLFLFRSVGRSGPRLPASRPLERVVQHVATAIETAIQTIEISVVQQLSTVATITVEAIGYFVAHVRSEGENGILRISQGDEVRHVVRLDQPYTLTIAYRRNEPGGYQGARVRISERTESVELEFEVTGDGFEIEEPAAEPRTQAVDRGAAARPSPDQPWRADLQIRPGTDRSIDLRVTPRAQGTCALSMQIYQGAAWAQRLDLQFDVHQGSEVERLTRPARKQEADEEIVVAKGVETMSTLSVIDDPLPRALHLQCRLNRTRLDGHTFDVHAKNGRDSRPLRVLLTEDDLVEINVMLQQELDLLRSEFGDEDCGGPDQDEERRAILEQLATSGSAALKQIFPDAEDRRYLLEAARQGNVEISTDRFFPHWELLYDGELDAELRYDGFWGYRFDLSRILTTVSQRASPLVTLTGKPRVAMFANQDLDHVATDEVPFLYDLAKQKKIELLDWSQNLKAMGAAPTRRHFIAFCQERESELAHFACHAVADPEVGLRSYLELTPDLAVSLREMAAGDYALAGAPLVLLNACGTGVRDPRRTSDFVQQFSMSGSRGVLATECDVPDHFASRFIQHVYEGILGGATLGHSVLAARRHFLKSAGNPLGLLYAVYAPLETRLVEPENAVKGRPPR